MQQALTCCFTGHRNIPKKEQALLRQRLEQLLRELAAKGITNFIAGGALGFDMLASETVLSLRRELPQIKLRLALPCEGQDAKWSAADKIRYAALLEQADEIVYTAQSYSAGCMHLRNRYMVDNSAYCIAYLKYSKGGTVYTVNYAIKNKRYICNLARAISE